MVEIVYVDRSHIKSYNDAVCEVAREAKYLTTTEGFSLKESEFFVSYILHNNYSQYFAIDNGRVVGWCDIVPKTGDFYKHIGILGVGVLKEYRGQGIGGKLLYATIKKAETKGIEKIELEVFASNKVAIQLYKAFGFVVEGTKVKGKQFKDTYEDIIIMGKFLK